MIHFLLVSPTIISRFVADQGYSSLFQRPKAPNHPPHTLSLWSTTRQLEMDWLVDDVTLTGFSITATFLSRIFVTLCRIFVTFKPAWVVKYKRVWPTFLYEWVLFRVCSLEAFFGSQNKGPMKLLYTPCILGWIKFCAQHIYRNPNAPTQRNPNSWSF